jgi:hypothetical protein
MVRLAPKLAVQGLDGRPQARELAHEEWVQGAGGAQRGQLRAQPLDQGQALAQRARTVAFGPGAKLRIGALGGRQLS